MHTINETRYQSLVSIILIILGALFGTLYSPIEKIVNPQDSDTLLILFYLDLSLCSLAVLTISTMIIFFLKLDVDHFVKCNTKWAFRIILSDLILGKIYLFHFLSCNYFNWCQSVTTLITVFCVGFVLFFFGYLSGRIIEAIKMEESTQNLRTLFNRNQISIVTDSHDDNLVHLALLELTNVILNVDNPEVNS
jgi:hypothetical protein